MDAKKIRKKLKLKYVEKEMASYIELGADAYIKKASKKLAKATGQGTRKASSYWIRTDDGKRYPLKALGRMAALRGNFTENSYPDYWVEPFKDLGFSVVHDLSKGQIDERSKFIKKMGQSVKKTVGQSNGQEKTVRVKNKLQNLSDDELVTEIERLMDEQINKCALTGLPLDFSENCNDPEMRPSLDRIDSDGHYELGNLQVVCKFANFWKRNQTNDEFVRLLAIVRNESEPVQ